MTEPLKRAKTKNYDLDLVLKINYNSISESSEADKAKYNLVLQGQIGAIVSQIYKITNNRMCAFAARTAAYLSIAGSW